ncbi:MAG TPA: response regulator [Actinomycetota bacterium]|nr:response regulator [Actinomycetota bacterium]
MSDGGRGRRDRVLVVDDDDEIRRLVGLCLEAAGFDVIEAYDGDEALDAVVNEAPDVVVLDVMMPRLDGMEVCRRIRANLETRAISVVLLSARTSSTDKMAGFRAGADDYMTKPFDPEELVERVKATLGRSRQMTSLNPLTGLPGNLDIEQKLVEAIEGGSNFALMHVDIDNFKAFNDYYGVLRGDQAIKLLSRCIFQAFDESETQDSFVGHVGGDDFVVIVEADGAALIAQRIIDLWDRWVPTLYEIEDAERGYIKIADRQKRTHKFPAMTLSIGIATNLLTAFDSHIHAADVASEMKHVAKRDPQSSFAVDRRGSGADRSRPPDPRTVLIVDDDPDTREVLRLHCEFLGFHVVGEAANGLEAIELAEQHQPSFVILDQRMPMLEGPETAARLRLVVPDVTIIAFTAFAHEKPPWADEFLGKNDVAELTPFLDKVLGREDASTSQAPEG